MRQHLTPMEAVFACALIGSLTAAFLSGKLSAEGYIGGIGWLLTYATGKANGYKRFKAERSTEE